MHDPSAPALLTYAPDDGAHGDCAAEEIGGTPDGGAAVEG